MFFKHARAEEATRVLNGYYKSYDISSVMKLLRLIKCDIKAFESIRWWTANLVAKLYDDFYKSIKFICKEQWEELNQSERWQ